MKKRCNCPTRCKYCGARLRKDYCGHICPTNGCQWSYQGKGVPCKDKNGGDR